MKKNTRNFKKYEVENAEYLHSTEDMAHHTVDGYKVDDEIHLVYENGTVAIAKISEIHTKTDKFLWTPFIEF